MTTHADTIRVTEAIERMLAAGEADLRRHDCWDAVARSARGEVFDLPIRHLDRTSQAHLDSCLVDATVRRLWSRGKVVYPVHPQMRLELAGTDPSAQIPGDIFDRLPHRDPLIVFPEPVQMRSADDKPARLLGFHVYGNYRAVDGRRVVCSSHDEQRVKLGLMFVAEILDDAGRAVDMDVTRVSVPVAASGFTVEDAVEATMAQFAATTQTADPGGHRRYVAETIPAALNILLYLCCKEPDVEPARSSRPGKVGRKGADRTRPVAMLKVGWRVGPAIYAARRAHAQARAAGTAGPGKAPHPVRSHIRTYWTGPGRKTAELRFIAPYFCGLDPDAVMPTHTVVRTHPA